VDGEGNAYITGETSSSDFPTLDPIYHNGVTYDTRRGVIGNAFVTKIMPAGGALVYSSYLGGNLQDVGTAIAVDDNLNVHVTGWTLSTDFPTKDPLKHNGTIYNSLQSVGKSDAFVTKLNRAGNTLSYSTYLGGSDIDGGTRYCFGQ
jgi:hypothetical protein